jgi:O-antigen/teichoic acid export membrane protein
VTDKPKNSALQRTWAWSLRLHVTYRDINWAMVDQVIVSGVNFLTMVILARTLGVEHFGRFSIAWLVLLFFKSIQAELVVSSMMSIGPKQAPQELPLYYGAVIVQQSAIALLAFLVIVVAVPVTGMMAVDLGLAGLGLALAAATAADQLQDFVRRYLYTRQRAFAACWNDILCSGVRILLLLGMVYFGATGGALALWLIAAASALAAAVGALLVEPVRFDRGFTLRTCGHHWAFSKWLFGSSILRWMSGNLIVLMSGGILGAYAVGAIRSTTNILAPVQVFILALNNIAPVKAAQLFHDRGAAALLRYIGKLTLVGSAVTVAMVIFGSIFADQIVRLLYGEEYVPYAYLVHWWAIIYLIGFLEFPLGVGLKAIEHTRPFFYAVVLEAIFAVSASYLLALYFGLPGAMFGILVVKIIPVSVLSACFLRRLPPWRHLATPER